MRYLLLGMALLTLSAAIPSTPAAETAASGILIEVYKSPG